MLILALVCVAWLEIIGIQSAKKEACRREAVERLSGMMDAFMEIKKDVQIKACEYLMEKKGNEIQFKDVGTKTDVHPMFSDGSSPIGYRLCVVVGGDDLVKGMPKDDWGYDNGKGSVKALQWLVGRLYDSSDADDCKPFFTLPVCLWRN